MLCRRLLAGYSLKFLLAVSLVTATMPVAGAVASPSGSHPVEAAATTDLTAISGKGIWWDTWGNVTHAQARAVVKWARAAHVTAIYPRVGSTVSGFYGTELLDVLLPLAHAAGIRVVAWYWSDLSDPALAIQIARYTIGGQRVDAISPDIEAENHSAEVRNWYKQHQKSRQIAAANLPPPTPDGAPGPVLDAYFSGIRHGAGGLPGLGARYLIVSTTWAMPYEHLGYDFAAMSRWTQAFAPMAYWRASGVYAGARGVAAYFDKVNREFADSRVNPYHRPLSFIGQNFNATSKGDIVGSPPGAEITAALTEAKKLGAAGCSFYEYGNSTREERAAMAAFSWTVRLLAPPAPNLLTNGSFETGNMTDWAARGDVTLAAVVADSTAEDGANYLHFSTGGSAGWVAQDDSLTVRAGQGYLFTAWVRAEGSQSLAGSLSLWLAGTPHTRATFTASPGGWRLISVPIGAWVDSSVLSAEVGLDTPNATLDVDGAQLRQVSSGAATSTKKAPSPTKPPQHQANAAPIQYHSPPSNAASTPPRTPSTTTTPAANPPSPSPPAQTDDCRAWVRDANRAC